MIGPYSKVQRSVWLDDNFRALSERAKLLWFYLLTGPQCTSIPGLFCLSLFEIAGRMRWSLEDAQSVFGEIESLGMVRADLHRELVWVPNALHYNAPQNPNVVVGWGKVWGMLPKCELLTEATDRFKEELSAIGAEYLRSFEIACGNAPRRKSSNPTGKARPNHSPNGIPNHSVNGIPNQEQEQEQEKEQKAAEQEIRARDPITSPPPILLPTVERLSAVDPDELLLAARRGSDQRLFKLVSNTEKVIIKRLASEMGLTALDFELLGEAFLEKRAWPTMEYTPSTSLLLKDEARMLKDGLEHAMRWRESKQVDEQALKTFEEQSRAAHAQNIAALNQSIGSNKPGRFTNRVMVKSA